MADEPKISRFHKIHYWNVEDLLAIGTYVDWEGFANAKEVLEFVQSASKDALYWQEIVAEKSGSAPSIARGLTDSLAQATTDIVTHYVYEEVDQGSGREILKSKAYKARIAEVLDFLGWLTGSKLYMKSGAKGE